MQLYVTLISSSTLISSLEFMTSVIITYSQSWICQTLTRLKIEGKEREEIENQN